MIKVHAIRIAVLGAALAAAAHAAKTFDIYFIDVEGGQSTLLVSPSGQSLLIDAGFAGNGGRDADRIAAAAKAAGVKRIDYLLITHFHPDHVGGVSNLLERLPVVNFLDHGDPVDTKAYPEAYVTAFEKGQHKTVSPGMAIPVKDLNVTVVAAGGQAINRRGEPNSFCAGLTPHPNDEKGEMGEDPQSAGVVVEFGKFRFMDLADLTWNKQLALFCPENRVGQIDVYLTSRHGGDSPQAFEAIAPRVAIMNNGPRKGGAATAWHTVKDTPHLEDLWQLHFAIAGGKDANSPDTFIANVDEQCQGQFLKVSANADGSFTVFNQRNKFSKNYTARKN
jgi:beta-lactamase superfamily II metal-dependent hydrolase